MKQLNNVTLVNGLSEIYQLFTQLYPELVPQVKEWYQWDEYTDTSRGLYHDPGRDDDRWQMDHSLQIHPGQNYVPAHEGKPGQQVELFNLVCGYPDGDAEQNLPSAEPSQG